jgi:hypothetical protein
LAADAEMAWAGQERRDGVDMNQVAADTERPGRRGTPLLAPKSLMPFERWPCLGDDDATPDSSVVDTLPGLKPSFVDLGLEMADWCHAHGWPRIHTLPGGDRRDSSKSPRR